MGVKASPALVRKLSALAPSVAVPPPPSVNNLYVTVRRNGKAVRVRSKGYAAWRAKAEPVLLTLRGPAAYPCGVRMTLFGQVSVNSDLDNRWKGLLDAMVAVGVLKADNVRHVNDLHARYEPSDGEPCVLVEVVG